MNSFLIKIIFLSVGLLIMWACSKPIKHEAEDITEKVFTEKKKKTLAGAANEDNPKADTSKSLSFEEALEGSTAPEEIVQQLALLEISYLDFDSLTQTGYLVVHKDLKAELTQIFDSIYSLGYPLEQVRPIQEFGWNDDTSMHYNNTSAFNYRSPKGMKSLSTHALGRAIDLNPKYNPHFKNGKVHPPNGVYDLALPYTLTNGHPVVKLFKSYGWSWGGDWRSSKDYQHFEKK